MVDNYWLDKHASLLFEGFRRRLPRAEGAEAAKDPRDVAWRIETFDFSRYQGERVHFEVQDDGPGWIEVDTILMTDTATPPPAEAWDADGPATGWNPSTPGLAEARARAVEAREALLACAFGWAENMAQAAMKSVPLGQAAAQRILARLAQAIPAAVEEALARPDDALQAHAPMLAILSSRHEAQYSRLFRS